MAKSVKDAYAAVLGGKRERKTKTPALPMAPAAVDVVDVVERHVQAITQQVREQYGTTSYVEHAPLECLVCTGMPDVPHLHRGKLWQGGKEIF